MIPAIVDVANLTALNITPAHSDTLIRRSSKPLRTRNDSLIPSAVRALPALRRKRAYSTLSTTVKLPNLQQLPDQARANSMAVTEDELDILAPPGDRAWLQHEAGRLYALHDSDEDEDDWPSEIFLASGLRVRTFEFVPTENDPRIPLMTGIEPPLHRRWSRRASDSFRSAGKFALGSVNRVSSKLSCRRFSLTRSLRRADAGVSLGEWARGERSRVQLDVEERRRDSDGRDAELRMFRAEFGMVV